MLRIDLNIHNKWMNTIGFFSLGSIMSLAQAPFDLSFVYFFIIPLLGLYFRDLKEHKTGFKVGLLVGLGYFGCSMIWIIEPFLIDPVRTGWFAPFALIIMATGLGLFWAIAFYITVWLTSTGKIRLVIFALAWSLAEYLRSTVFTGFPWGHISYGLSDLPMIQLTSWVGIHGLGLIILLICFMPIIIPRNLFISTLIMLLTLLICNIYGFWRSNNQLTPNILNTIIRVIQPNASQNLKWRPDMIDFFYERQLAFTKDISDQKPDIVIWPESSIPGYLDYNTGLINEISTAAGRETFVILGAIRKKNNLNFNSLAVVGANGDIEALYDKKHLVPFGEYLPFHSFFKLLGFSNFTSLVGNFQSGNSSRIVNVKNIPNFLALICYELIFPKYSKEDRNRPNWIVHITNDAWFGTFSGPYQHLVQARTRAIEQGLPLVRSANTGISAIIDPYGNILNSIELGTSGYFDAALPAKLPPTPYAKFGELFWVLICVLLLLASSKNIYRKHFIK
jgi:apolipoprotein N-acyltransferase